MEYDSPVFKRLAANDTSKAPGHQGGIVIPKDLEGYFPRLEGEISAAFPTLDEAVHAELLVDDIFVGSVVTRYQHQTWGGTRSPERRLTSNLGPIRDAATEGDLLLIQRSLESPKSVRLNLVRQGTQQFARWAKDIGLRRWGVLIPATDPMKNVELEKAIAEEQEKESGPFQLIVANIATVVSTGMRIARNAAFRQRVLRLYENRCAVTGVGLVSPSGAIGIDATHIVPLDRRGSDDVRNGLALSKDLHWAFDRGLWSVSRERRVVVPDLFKQHSMNENLKKLEGQKLSEANSSSLRASQDAFDWHRENVMLPT